MKKVVPFLLVLICLPLLLQARGKVIESLSFVSRSGSVMKYSVYLPDGFDASERSYPALYLLHGYSDDETGWVQFGEADRIADRLFADGKAAPAVIIMPDGKLTWYTDSYNGTEQWESIFINELIPMVEKQYHLRSKKEYRAIAGLSMGGYGAMKLALKYNDKFSACVAMSAAFFSDEEILAMTDQNYNHTFFEIWGKNLKGKDRLNAHWKANNPLDLITSLPVDKVKSVKYLIDCGDDDFLYKGNSLMHIKLRDLGVPHEFRIRDGAHTWSYWRTGLDTGLRFITAGFRR